MKELIDSFFNPKETYIHNTLEIKNKGVFLSISFYCLYCDKKCNKKSLEGERRLDHFCIHCGKEIVLKKKEDGKYYQYEK